MSTAVYFVVQVALVCLAVAHSVGWRSRATWLFFAVFLTLFIGLRHNVGMDWSNYIHMTRHIAFINIWDAFDRAEPSYALLTKVSAELGLGVYGVNCAVACIFVFGLYTLCSKTENPWMGLAVAFPLLIVVVANSATRQSAAIGIMMWAIARWSDISVRSRVASILLAASFHYSAILFLAIVAFESRQSAALRIALGLLVVLLTGWLISQLEPQTGYVSNYIFEQAPRVLSPGAFMHVILNAGPAVLLFAFYKAYRPLISQNLVIYLAALSIILLPVSIYYSTAASRLSFYLFPVSICVIASLSSLFRLRWQRGMVSLLVGSLLLAQLWIWLNYANNRIGYIPYRNAILVDSRELDLR